MPKRTDAQWAILILFSLVLMVLLEVVRLPAALLLGAMGAAIAVSFMGATVRVPTSLFLVAQGILGCMIARSIPLSLLGELVRNWPLFLVGIVSVIAASTLLGWLLARWRVLPGTSAIWGSLPGAATAMVILADAHGADARIVAVMQYSRILCVAVVASLVSRFWVTGPIGHHPDIVWFPGLAWGPFAATLGVVGFAIFAAGRLRLPGGPLLLSLAVGLLLQDTAGLSIELPPWLLAIGYSVIGWSVGLRFTRPMLIHTVRSLPRILASILLLISLCGMLAALLVVVAGVDPLTAYLATSPGGADAAAIIAASSNVDLPFVMTMQISRFLIVLLIGPSVARFAAKLVPS